MSTHHAVVIGGGLAGLSAAHRLIEQGIGVTLIDKKPSLGGNSVKASSGINGAETEAQRQLNINDTVDAFIADTTASAGPFLARPHLIKALTSNSAPAISWLTNQFGVDLSLVTRLGGHSIPRTHRGEGGAPGWAITSALMKKLETLARTDPGKVKVLKATKVIGLVEDMGRVSGVQYDWNGEILTEAGSVVIATGGYAADFTEKGYLAQFRPDLLTLPTTNGDHATGDGHRLVLTLNRSGTLCDMDQVQVHPTGFVDPKDPTAKTKFLAAEALRGVGGLLITKDGERFVNELDRRDAVTGKMQEVIKDGKAPIRILMNVEAYQVLKAHCDFYISKGLMKKYENAKIFSEETNVSVDTLRATFEAHTKAAAGLAADPFGKNTFDNAVYNLDAAIFVAEMTPVVHYTMGGITVDAEGHVLDHSSFPIKGLYAAGEAIGGVHGQNRLGGSSLLEAVVFGRIAGETLAKEF